MKIYNRRKLIYTLLTFAIALPLSLNSASALIKRSIIKIPLDKKDNPNKPASKLEIIAAVKAKYTGKIEILSIRKKPKSYGINCHSVKMLDSKDEFIEIQVACKK